MSTICEIYLVIWYSNGIIFYNDNKNFVHKEMKNICIESYCAENVNKKI